MPPIYFLAVLVVVAGSACFADGGGDTAAELTVQCPGDSCAEICKCYPECGPSNCSRRGDNYTILLQLGYCLDIHRHLVEWSLCQQQVEDGQKRCSITYSSSMSCLLITPCVMTSIAKATFVPAARKGMV